MLCHYYHTARVGDVYNVYLQSRAIVCVCVCVCVRVCVNSLRNQFPISRVYFRAYVMYDCSIVHNIKLDSHGRAYIIYADASEQ